MRIFEKKFWNLYILFLKKVDPVDKEEIWMIKMFGVYFLFLWVNLLEIYFWWNILNTTCLLLMMCLASGYKINLKCYFNTRIVAWQVKRMMLASDMGADETSSCSWEFQLL